jgi:hypothetical protein
MAKCVEVINMKFKYDIYLAHPGTESSRAYGKVLQAVMEKEGYKVYNPFSTGKGLEMHKKLRSGDTSLELARQIVHEDLQAIRDSNVIVAFMPEPSIGTSMEIFWANCIIDMPIIILTDMVHPWLMCSGQIVKTTEELLEELKKCV